MRKNTYLVLGLVIFFFMALFTANTTNYSYAQAPDPGCTNNDCAPPPDPGCTNNDCAPPPDPGCTNNDCPEPDPNYPSYPENCSCSEDINPATEDTERICCCLYLPTRERLTCRQSRVISYDPAMHETISDILLIFGPDAIHDQYLCAPDWLIDYVGDAWQQLRDDSDWWKEIYKCIDIEIKPGICPKIWNLKKDSLFIAILGSAGFDVRKIDPTTVMLEGVYAENWSYRDETMPFNHTSIRFGSMGITKDGFTDLILRFNPKKVLKSIVTAGALSDGDDLLLTVTGNLLEQYGSAPIIGEGTLKIKKK